MPQTINLLIWARFYVPFGVWMVLRHIGVVVNLGLGGITQLAGLLWWWGCSLVLSLCFLPWLPPAHLFVYLATKIIPSGLWHWDFLRVYQMDSNMKPGAGVGFMHCQPLCIIIKIQVCTRHVLPTMQFLNLNLRSLHMAAFLSSSFDMMFLACTRKLV
jgi:hypothetical protein